MPGHSPIANNRGSRNRHVAPRRGTVRLASFFLIIVAVVPSSFPAAAQDEEKAVVEILDFMVAPAVAAVKKGDPLPFLKPLINSELSFIKRVCDPTAEQMEAIVEAAAQSYEKTGDMVGDNENRAFNNADFRIVGPNNEQLNTDPFKRIRSDARNYLQPLVSQEQYARYEMEADQRDAFEQGAAIEIIVGMIDHKLVLTEDQRTNLTEVLMEKWKNIHLQAIQTYLHNPGYVPQLPSKTIDKVVTAQQLKIWQTLQQVTFSSQFTFGTDGMALEGEDWLK